MSAQADTAAKLIRAARRHLARLRRDLNKAESVLEEVTHLFELEASKSGNRPKKKNGRRYSAVQAARQLVRESGDKPLFS